MKTNTPSHEYKIVVIGKRRVKLPAWLVNGQPQSILERN
jgi:hypothetical protein